MGPLKSQHTPEAECQKLPGCLLLSPAGRQSLLTPCACGISVTEAYQQMSQTSCACGTSVTEAHQQISQTSCACGISAIEAQQQMSQTSYACEQQDLLIVLILESTGLKS